MKYFSIGLLLLIGTTFCLQAQNCKPDLDQTDKISKTVNLAWESTLFETGLANSMVNTSDWYLTLQFGRYGDQNLISLFIMKYEGSAQNASFESQYKGENGKQYYFSFTQGGDPIKLVVQQTNTVTKMNNVVNELVTTITLTSVLTQADINNFKSHFDNGSISAVRAFLAGDIKFEKEVKSGRAGKAAEKFACFYDHNEKNKVVVTEQNLNNLPPNPDVPAMLPRDSTTDKVTFADVIKVEGATKEQLYNRAKSWMVNYYKNEQFAINNQEDGRITRDGMFQKTYNMGKGTTATDNNTYTISVYIKDEKYKYEITDIVMDDGKNKATIEDDLEIIKSYPKFTAYVNQQIYEGVTDILKSLKAAMLVDAKKKDW